MAPRLRQASSQQQKTFLPAKDNPFTVQLTCSIPFKFQACNWDSQLKRLQKLNFRAAIVGGRGTGKSTCLRTLQTKLIEIGFRCHYLFLPREKRCHASLVNDALMHNDTETILLLDGIERLRLPLKWKVLRTKKIIATVHRRQVIPLLHLPTWFVTSTCKELMTDVLHNLEIDDYGIHVRANQLFDIHNGNIREVLRDLYDLKAANAL